MRNSNYYLCHLYCAKLHTLLQRQIIYFAENFMALPSSLSVWVAYSPSHLLSVPWFHTAGGPADVGPQGLWDS